MGRRRWWLVALATVLAIPLLGLAAGLAWLSGSLPKTDGAVAVAGIDGAVTLSRDRHGVAYIEAESPVDALFGLGFAHGQDRLWQMELTRRAGAGRLAEIFGARAIDQDKYLRTLGIADRAEQALAQISPDSRALVDGYARGVTAAIEHRSGPLPIEFQVFRHRPEPWTAADSVIAIKMMALILSENAHGELLRARLLEILTPEQVADLWPPYPDDPAARLSDAAPDAAPGVIGGAGSNNWAVHGDRAASGGAILANDPHLGLTVPAYWYLAHLRAPGMTVLGGSLPGIPGFPVGRNRHVAWGVTNTGPDVQDLFLERIDPGDPDRYLTPGGSDAFATRQETIAVRDAPAVPITVRETRHGPVMSDVSDDYAAIAGVGHVTALAWTALADTDPTIEAGLALLHATDVASAIAALEKFHVPQQNFVLADTTGAIGFIAAGRVPIRRDSDGWLPAEGWTGQGDWIDTIPFDALPRVVDPPSGRIVTANQKIVPDDYPYLITRDWQTPYRAGRIAELIDTGTPHDQADSQAIQTDILSPMAVEMLPLLLAAPGTGPARDLLAAWDGTMRVDTAEPLIFHAWMRALGKRIAADELGPLFRRAWSYRPRFVANVLTDKQDWCDDVTTAARETCDDQIAAALDDALAWIAERHGRDMSKWRWGDAHMAHSRHRPFSGIPVLGRLFDIRAPHGGGPYTVMQANVRLGNEAAPFTEVHGASLRFITDMSDPDSTLAMISTGQSGNRLSRHYADLADLWVAGDYIQIPMSDGAVEAAVDSRLTLQPLADMTQ